MEDIQRISSVCLKKEFRNTENNPKSLHRILLLLLSHPTFSFVTHLKLTFVFTLFKNFLLLLSSLIIFYFIIFIFIISKRFSTVEMVSYICGWKIIRVCTKNNSFFLSQRWEAWGNKKFNGVFEPHF